MGASAMLRWPVDVTIRPERLVIASATDTDRRLGARFAEGIRLFLFLVLNILLYAVPLTLAGYGIGSESSPPVEFLTIVGPLIADPVWAWQFLVALSTNSGFILVATLLTFVTFHVGIVLSGQSRGLNHSLRAVSYSTGIYLAIIFTLVWYVATAPAVQVADDVLLWVQRRFFYYFIDLLGVALELPGGRPAILPPTGLTGVGLTLLTLLVVAAFYFLYVLYVGAKVGHGATRVQALVATLFVLVSPALYAIGIILYSLNVSP